jgi:hypothetical protein
MQGRVTEKVLVEVWHRQLLNKRAMTTTEGRRLRVIHPGRRNTDSGPDFLDATLAVEGVGLLQGDVEIHVRAEDWRAHGHHRDRNYDGVILHVVMWEGNCSQAGLLRSGRRVEVLPLHQCVATPMRKARRDLQQPGPFAESCARAPEAPAEERVWEILEEAGDARFHLKAQGFEGQMANRAPEEILYEGVMVALGYTKNKAPFRELARRLPLSSLRLAVREVAPKARLQLIQASLLGAAGMLPGQRHMLIRDPWEEALQQAWGQVGTEAMTIGQWAFFRVRLENTPVRRVAGASMLLAGCLEEGLLPSMLRSMSQTSAERSRGELERELTIPSQGFWAKYHDFGMPTTQRTALIGRNRARDVVVNVILPFFHAWAGITGECWLAEHSWAIYRRYPPLQENWMTRHMETQILGPRRPFGINSARRQQGLIHLHQTFCAKLRCDACQLNCGG